MKPGLLASLILLLASVAAWPAADLCQIRTSALDFILHEQVKADGPTYQKGEWPANVTLGGYAKDLGFLNPGPFEDPNLFTIASVHNVLAEIYLKHGQDRRLLLPMKAASKAMGRYLMKDNRYNFWPLRQGVVDDVTKDLHLPAFQLSISAVDGLLAIPADADDTAVAALAHFYDRAVCLRTRPPGACPEEWSHVETAFTPFTDGFRLPAPSNMGRGEFGTGAYMTWLQHEPFLPWAGHIFAAQGAGPRIVLDTNDVDCVVNANVVRSLTAYRRTDAAGYANACALLTDNARDDDFSSCGDYYPDTYWYHYAVARAFSEGAQCLRAAAELSLRSIARAQLPDGRWHNEVIRQDGDDVLATAFALGALLKAGNRSDPSQVAIARKGMVYLLSRVRRRGALAYWPGGVFFSAGSPVRSGVLWRSDSFTTSVVALALFDAAAWLPHGEKCL